MDEWLVLLPNNKIISSLCPYSSLSPLQCLLGWLPPVTSTGIKTQDSNEWRNAFSKQECIFERQNLPSVSFGVLSARWQSCSGAGAPGRAQCCSDHGSVHSPGLRPNTSGPLWRDHRDMCILSQYKADKWDFRWDFRWLSSPTFFPLTLFFHAASVEKPF